MSVGDVLGQETADVLQGGSITFTQMFETFIGSGQLAPATGVTIAITAATTPDGGTGTPLAATSAGITSPDGATYSYAWLVPASTVPGTYLVTWTGTGGSSGSTVLTYEQSVTVAAIATGVPGSGVYASYAQYQAWSGDTVTPSSVMTPLLQRASEDLDRALMGGYYAVTPDGMPADALVIDVLSRACCAQAQFLYADNDITGVKRQYATTNVAGVNATRTKAAQSPDMPPLGPRALSILHVNGVLPSAVLIAW